MWFAPSAAVFLLILTQNDVSCLHGKEFLEGLIRFPVDAARMFRNMLDGIVSRVNSTGGSSEHEVGISGRNPDNKIRDDLPGDLKKEGSPGNPLQFFFFNINPREANATALPSRPTNFMNAFRTPLSRFDEAFNFHPDFKLPNLDMENSNPKHNFAIQGRGNWDANPNNQPLFENMDQRREEALKYFSKYTPNPDLSSKVIESMRNLGDRLWSDAFLKKLQMKRVKPEVNLEGYGKKFGFPDFNFQKSLNKHNSPDWNLINKDGQNNYEDEETNKSIFDLIKNANGEKVNELQRKWNQFADDFEGYGGKFAIPGFDSPVNGKVLPRANNFPNNWNSLSNEIAKTFPTNMQPKYVKPRQQLNPFLKSRTRLTNPVRGKLSPTDIGMFDDDLEETLDSVQELNPFYDLQDESPEDIEEDYEGLLDIMNKWDPSLEEDSLEDWDRSSGDAEIVNMNLEDYWNGDIYPSPQEGSSSSEIPCGPLCESQLHVNYQVWDYPEASLEEPAWIDNGKVTPFPQTSPVIPEIPLTSQGSEENRNFIFGPNNNKVKLNVNQEQDMNADDLDDSKASSLQLQMSPSRKERSEGRGRLKNSGLNDKQKNNDVGRNTIGSDKNPWNEDSYWVRNADPSKKSPLADPPTADPTVPGTLHADGTSTPTVYDPRENIQYDQNSAHSGQIPQQMDPIKENKSKRNNQEGGGLDNWIPGDQRENTAKHKKQQNRTCLECLDVIRLMTALRLSHRVTSPIR